jgi:preprotein translocase subunit SecA
VIKKAIESVITKQCKEMLDDKKYPLLRLVEWERKTLGVEFDDPDRECWRLARVQPTPSEVANAPAQEIETLVRERAKNLEALIKETARDNVRNEISISLGEYLGDYSDPSTWDSSGLSKWAMSAFRVNLSISKIKRLSPHEIEEQLTAAALEQVEKKDGLPPVEFLRPDFALQRFAEWARTKFDIAVTVEELKEISHDEVQRRLAEQSVAKYHALRGRYSDRSDLADLERNLLLYVYDAKWKDHLYMMDHLKDSIWTRSLAEKDPKVEYKKEAFQMFNEMLESIDDRVAGVIFGEPLDEGAQARDVNRGGQASHDEVGQFAAGEQQRAAAQAPQGEVKVKQIRLEQPKVGRNDPCPCGSGKKYKKCHGQNAEPGGA